MRIVGGRWAGRSLTSPGGRVRPTGEELRDRWLSSLGADLRGARVLELFAGSGALGLEALSRGAATVDFVEWNPSALHSLRANVAALRARPATRIFTRDAMEFARGLEPGAYDVVLADPPYTSRLAEALVSLWRDRPFSRILGVEHPSDRPPAPGGRTLAVEGAAVTIYRSVTPSGRPGPGGP